MEVADAESYAIYAYLRRVIERGGGKQSRVFILSDCLGVVTALEVAWRKGVQGLRKCDRGALVEAIVCLREQLGTVVLLWVPSHTGVIPNSYADAAAKSYQGGATTSGLYDKVCRSVALRPCAVRLQGRWCAAEEGRGVGRLGAVG